jgi:hypothetical protein
MIDGRRESMASRRIPTERAGPAFSPGAALILIIYIIGVSLLALTFLALALPPPAGNPQKTGHFAAPRALTPGQPQIGAPGASQGHFGGIPPDLPASVASANNTLGPSGTFRTAPISTASTAVGPQAAPAPPSQAKAAAQPLVFRNQIVMDPQGFGYEVFRMLVPKDWKFEGGVSWDYSKIPPHVYTAYTVSSPDGHSALHCYPAIGYLWSQDPNSNAINAQSGYPVMQNMGAAEFLQRVFIPQARAGVSDMRVIETQPLPAQAQQMLAITNMQTQIFNQISPPQSPMENRVDAARVLVEYTYGGRKMTEDFQATVVYNIGYVMSMYGQLATITWTPVVTSFRAPSEEMPAKIRIFQVMLYSRADNPLFTVNYTQLSAVITREQLRHQQAIYARLQQIRQTMTEVSDMTWQAFQNRSAAQDRAFENYTQAFRGVATYIDPNTNRGVELPSGYGNVWTNGSEYILSDVPGYNPNTGSSRIWQPMNRK